MLIQPKILPGSALIVALVDILIMLVAGYGAAVLRFDSGFPESEAYRLLIPLSVALYLLVALFSGNYQSWKGLTLTALLYRFSFAFAITVTAVFAWLVFSKDAEIISRLWLGTALVTIYILGILFRVCYFHLIKSLRRKGYNVENVFVAYTQDSDIARFDESVVVDEGFNIGLKYQVDTDDSDYTFLLEALRSTNCYELWLFIPLESSAQIKDILHAVRLETINIRLLPDFGDLALLSASSCEIGDNIALNLTCSPIEGKDAVLKRTFDIAVSFGILLCIWPVMLLIAIVVKATSIGPVTFAQERNGLYGKKFWVYKFRSMQVHDEADGTITQAKENDSRLTSIGAFLRKTSLDELPQFFNVLKGDMSIVGPRPHALAHNEYYKEQVEAYMWRNKVKPGITGWAQINGYRGETDTLEKMEKRIQHDLWYMENWSFWWDVKIFVKTFASGFTDKNAY